MLLVVTFGIVRLIPGDPARLVAGPHASDQAVQALRHQLGLDQPLIAQFGHYVSGAVHLDFGNSFTTGQSVTSVLLQRLPYTLELAGASLLLMLVLGVLLGIVAAVLTRDNRHPSFEGGFMFVTGVASGIPNYLAATFLAFFFAVTVRLFPVSGAQGLRSIVLPALAVALKPTVMLARVVRVETLNVFVQDFMRAARSKRLRTPRLFALYVLPNVLNATLTLSGLLFISLIGGTIIVENVFAWPGLGTLEIQAIPALDYPVIQGATLLLGLIVVLVNTLVDVMRAIVDPQSVGQGR